MKKLVVFAMLVTMMIMMLSACALSEDDAHALFQDNLEALHSKNSGKLIHDDVYDQYVVWARAELLKNGIDVSKGETKEILTLTSCYGGPEFEIANIEFKNDNAIFADVMLDPTTFLQTYKEHQEVGIRKAVKKTWLGNEVEVSLKLDKTESGHMLSESSIVEIVKNLLDYNGILN